VKQKAIQIVEIMLVAILVIELGMVIYVNTPVLLPTVYRYSSQKECITHYFKPNFAPMTVEEYEKELAKAKTVISPEIGSFGYWMNKCERVSDNVWLFKLSRYNEDK